MMVNTVKELIELVHNECMEHGWHYLIQIDDGEHISGRYKVITNSKLHDMGRAISKLSDHYEEKEVINIP